MTDAVPFQMDRASALRAAFDGSFAIPPLVDATPMEDLLAIRVGQEPCVLRLSEVSGLFTGKTIALLPGGHASLLGIAGFRGSILPVYSIGALLGRSASEKPRWLSVASNAPVALAFDAFDGHMRIPRDAIVAYGEQSQARSHVREFVRSPDGVRPVIQLASILEFIRGLNHGSASAKE